MVNPKSPLENNMALASMTRNDQRLELRMVKEELKEKLERAQSAQANNLLSVARRKQKSFGYVDEFDKCLVAYMRRFRTWIEADKDSDEPNPDATLAKEDTFTGELKDRRMTAFAKLMLTREMILNEVSKMPSMPEMPDVSGTPAGLQLNQQINIDASGKGEGFNASDDFQAFKKSKTETDGG